MNSYFTRCRPRRRRRCCISSLFKQAGQRRRDSASIEYLLIEYLLLKLYLKILQISFSSDSIPCVFWCQTYQELNMYRQLSAQKHCHFTILSQFRVFQKPRIELVISRSCLQTVKRTCMAIVTRLLQLSASPASASSSARRGYVGSIAHPQRSRKLS